MHLALKPMEKLSADVEITNISGDAVLEYWIELVPLLNKALEMDGTMEAEHLLEQVYEGNALIWIVEKDDKFQAVAVTQIARYPAKDVLEVMTLTGSDFYVWADKLQQCFERYAKDNSLDGMRAYCRPGMARMLRKIGWQPKQEIMSYGR